MSTFTHRVIQVVVLGFCALMALGVGFFHREMLDGNVTRTATYTLYKSLPPPPQGPRFCEMATVGDYGLVAPCDYQPPFVWWLQHRR